MNQSDSPFFVDQIGHPAAAVAFFYFSVGVGHQRKGDTVGGRKSAVFAQAITADADDQRFAVCKFFQITLKVNDLRRSDGRKDGKIERQDDVFAAEVVR